jgi:hypothetical protein
LARRSTPGFLFSGSSNFEIRSSEEPEEELEGKIVQGDRVSPARQVPVQPEHSDRLGLKVL